MRTSLFSSVFNLFYSNLSFSYFGSHLYFPFSKLVFEQNRYTLPLILNVLLRCDTWRI